MIKTNLSTVQSQTATSANVCLHGENLHPAYRDVASTDARLKRDPAYRASPLVHINVKK